MKLSVIVTCKNSAKTIGATLESVLMQTHKDYEVIVVDGASTDGTQDVVKGFNSPRILLKSEPDRGSSDALNKGFWRATGEAITFLNSDDTFASPHVLANADRCFDSPDVGFVGCALQWVDPFTQKKLDIILSRPKGMLWGCTAFLPGGFFRRAIVPDPPFTDEIDLANDYDLLCDVLVRQKVGFRVHNDVAVYFTLGGRSNWSHNLVRVRMDLFKVRRKYFGLGLALAFAIPGLPLAAIRQFGFRPYTWGRRLKRLVQKTS